MRQVLIPLVPIVLAACIAGDDNGWVVRPTDTGSDLTLPSTTWSPTTTTGTPTGTGTPPTWTGSGVDCSVIPPLPTGWNTLSPNIPSSEEFAFDDAGLMWNIDDGVDYLFSSTNDGQDVQIIAPYNSAEVGAIRFMMDGRLAVADEGNGALQAMSLQGAIDVLIGSIPEPNSLAVHPNGWVYSTAMDQLWMYDPNNQTAQQQWVLPGTDLDGLVFTNDYQWLYFNHDEDGIVGKSRVNPDGSLQTPQIIVNLVEGAAELDGMAMDACDNLYVLFTDGRITRLIDDVITEDWITLQNFGGTWTTSLHFGTGVGGWERDHLYVMNRSGEMFDIDAGIIGKPEPHIAVPVATGGTTTTGTGQTTTGTSTSSTGGTGSSGTGATTGSSATGGTGTP